MKNLVCEQAVIPHILHPAGFSFTFVMRLLFVFVTALYIQSACADGVPLRPGDVFVTMDSGSGYTWRHNVNHFSPNGVLLDRFNFGVNNAWWESMGFDASNNLYIPTEGTNNEVVHTISGSGMLTGLFGGVYDLPTSEVVDTSGNVYVSQNSSANGSPGAILKFDGNGNQLATYSIPVDPYSGDAIDAMALANDQCTMRYTAMGQGIRQFNVCTNTQLSDFVSSLPDPFSGTNFELYEIRQLPNDNLLVGSFDIAYLLSSSGSVIQEYKISNNSSLISVFPDPDKHTFWTADWGANTIYRINIQTGAIVTSFQANAPNVSEGSYTLAIVPGNPNGKELGKSCNCIGDPINAATGNEYKDDEDLSLGALSFHRFYNSQTAVAPAHMGTNWRHSFDRSVEYLASNGLTTATVFRPDGKELNFTLTSGQWVSDPDVADRLVALTNTSGALTGWTYFDAATRYQESYDQNGNLLSITDTDGLVTTLTYSTTSTPTNVAPKAGLLLTVTDPRGRVLSFAYNSSSEVATITEPDSGVVTYGYDTTRNLTSVTYPDQTSRQYVYNESSLTSSTNLPAALTGDIDETSTRFTSISYNAQGSATMSMLPSNVAETQVAYNTDGTTSVTYPTGSQSTLSFTAQYGSMHRTAVSAPCGVQCDQPYASATYDTNGHLASATDFNGNRTATTYDANGLLDQQIDALGTPNQRTTNNTWATTLRVPLTRSVLDANGNTISSTQWIYNATGQVLARCDIDPTSSAGAGYSCANTGAVPAGVRRWTYTYCTAVDSTQCPLAGLMLTATGPRTDVAQVTTYSYYMSSSASNCGTPGAACYQVGDLHAITDPQGHVTTIASYDADGRITRISDANGVNTDLTYTSRGWLASRSVGGATTSFTYTPYGAVQALTDPDGVTTTYWYDTAHRLVEIDDALGNYIDYTLDGAGNKTAEQTYDSNGTLYKSLTRTFNTLGQLTSVVDGLNKTVFDAGASGSYDANGNLVQSADGLSIQHKLGYDALNRLVQTIDNYNGSDPSTRNTTVAYTHDSLDRLTQATDPSNLATTYTYDGLSDVTGQLSPDTGSTSRGFDVAGNAVTRTDAKGIAVIDSYDSLNRRTYTSYPVGTQNITYYYDEPNSTTGCVTSFPIGRQTRIIENAVTTVYCYDARGNVIEKRQITAAGTDITDYSYTAADRLAGILYPSGTSVSYVRGDDGRIQSVGVTPLSGTSSTAVSGVTYQPIGPVSGYTLGNGQAITRTYDANYRLTDLTSQALNLHFARDAMGNITAIGNAPGANPATETYSYDSLHRLTGFTDVSAALESYTYNQAGDRLSKTATGLATGAYLYTAGTHQLASIGGISRANDANGNTTGSVIGGNNYGFGYDERNRLTVAQLNGQTVGAYTYNAMGERIGKIATFPQAITERYAYDEAGNLLGEYGTTNRDYIWLGDLPVAVIDNTSNGSVTTSTLNYVTTDQLGTPRAVTDSTGAVIWSWAYQGNPFGEQQPTSSTGYVFNLRFAGQYYDAESGTNYNMYRTYEPATGRYLQSDPIGLDGGISTYAYVGGDPLSHADPLGLFLWPWEAPVMIYGGTPTQQAQVEAAVNQVFSTPLGQEMLAQINGPWYAHGSPQELYINDDGQNDSPFLGSGKLYVDPDSHNVIPTTNGRIFATLTRIIAHELGHSLMCDNDDGPGRMNNVNKNENPIVNALGQPSRTAYNLN